MCTNEPSGTVNVRFIDKAGELSLAPIGCCKEHEEELKAAYFGKQVVEMQDGTCLVQDIQ